MNEKNRIGLMLITTTFLIIGLYSCNKTHKVVPNPNIPAISFSEYKEYLENRKMVNGKIQTYEEYLESQKDVEVEKKNYNSDNSEPLRIKEIKATSKYKDDTGDQYVNIGMRLRNNTDKTVSEITFSVVFSDKRSNASDVTAPVESILYSVDSFPGTLLRNFPSKTETILNFDVDRPDNIYMVYSHIIIEQIKFDDGSMMDL